MFRSMTGYGIAVGTIDTLNLTVQVKSVNSRYLEIFLRLSGAPVTVEGAMRDQVKARLERGRVDVMVEVGGVGGEMLGIRREVAGHYLTQLRTLQNELGLPGEIALRDLLTLPGVLETAGDHRNALGREDVQAALPGLLSQALDALQEMRAREGDHLRTVMSERLDGIATGLETIAAGRESQRDRILDRLRRRLGDLLDRQPPLDEARLYQEAVYLADRTDITEEIDRFRSHLDQFRRALAGSSPVGKKLDFILQEMNREANTILSKSEQDDISHVGISIRSDLEKLREQVQNIE